MKKTLASIALLTATTFSMPLLAAYKVVDVTNGGSISGKINFTGKDKAPQIYKVAKDRQPRFLIHRLLRQHSQFYGFLCRRCPYL